MLTEAADHPDIARAEALRRSMLALMDDPDNPHFAHPLFWAPFVVVGEGGVPLHGVGTIDETRRPRTVQSNISPPTQKNDDFIDRMRRAIEKHQPQ